MDKKTDLRIIKTKRNLYEGFALLLAEKDYDSIKIKDICDKSLVNRSTFYDHYSSKKELLTSMIKNRQSELTKNLDIKAMNTDNYREIYMEYIKNLLNYIYKSKEVNKKILLKNNNNIAKEILFNIIIDDITKSLEKINKSDTPTELIAKFYVAGFSEVPCLYVEKPEIYTKEKVLDYTEKLLYKNTK